jgi:TolA-binding protein
MRDTATVARDTTVSDTTGRSKSDSAAVRVPLPPSLSLDTVNVRLAGRIDELAGLFYIGLGVPDSARWWYRRLLADFPDSKVAPRALYVLARIEAEDSTSVPGRADSLYREILSRFPSSPFADEARRLLGLPVVHKSEDPAEVSYARGVSLMQSGDSFAAIDTFKAIAGGYPTSPVASRALYAAGWLYENNTTLPDSAAANYESLVTRYPSSMYAVRVQPRVAEVQAARKQGLDKARADSIAAQAPGPTPTQDKARPDSIAAQAPQPPPVENKPAPTTEDPEGESLKARKQATPPDPNKKKPSETPDAESTW